MKPVKNMQNLKFSTTALSFKFKKIYMLLLMLYIFLRMSGSELREQRGPRTMVSRVCPVLRAWLCAAVAVSLSLLSSQWLAGAGPWWHIPLRPRHNRQGRGAKIVLILTVSWQSPTRLEGGNTQLKAEISDSVTESCGEVSSFQQSSSGKANNTTVSLSVNDLKIRLISS